MDLNLPLPIGLLVNNVEMEMLDSKIDEDDDLEPEDWSAFDHACGCGTRLGLKEVIVAPRRTNHGPIYMRQNDSGTITYAKETARLLKRAPPIRDIVKR